jgi:hypothetical protein
VPVIATLGVHVWPAIGADQLVDRFVVAPTARTLSGLEVLASYDEVPMKLAVKEWVPKASALVRSVATPELLTAAVASSVVPSNSFTEPLPTGAPEADTVAVKVAV